MVLRRSGVIFKTDRADRPDFIVFVAQTEIKPRNGRILIRGENGACVECFIFPDHKRMLQGELEMVRFSRIGAEKKSLMLL